MTDPAASNVVELDSARPHITLDCTPTGGAVHVFPLHLALQWASGRAPLPAEEILRRIILDWLCAMCDMEVGAPDDGPDAA